ncbi:MAG: prefoldin subunit alpha [archaeon]|nr:prefoldin subunit alpha [Nanoarchaeota archaeon]
MENKQAQYLLLQQMQEQVEALSKQLEEINEQLMELEISKGALEEVQKTKQGTEILAQIANGIFVKTELKDNTKLIVNVGANTTVEKSVPEVIKILEDHEQTMAQNAQEIETLLQQISQEAMLKIQGLEDQDIKTSE